MLMVHNALASFREFIESNYVDLKKSNPKLPILIRECSGVRPVIFARYGELLCHVMQLDTPAYTDYIGLSSRHLRPKQWSPNAIFIFVVNAIHVCIRLLEDKC